MPMQIIQLLANVLAADEDALEIHPLALNTEYGLDAFGDVVELSHPRIDALFEREVVRRVLHRRERHLMVLEHLEHVVGADHLVVVLFVLDDFDLHVAPLLLDVAETLLNAEFARRNRRQRRSDNTSSSQCRSRIASFFRSRTFDTRRPSMPMQIIHSGAILLSICRESSDSQVLMVN